MQLRVIALYYLASRCIDCGPNEKRFTLDFYDSERLYLRSTSLILRYKIGSQPPQIEAYLNTTDMTMLPAEDSPTETRVPFGEYVLTKQ